MQSSQKYQMQVLEQKLCRYKKIYLFTEKQPTVLLTWSSRHLQNYTSLSHQVKIRTPKQQRKKIHVPIILNARNFLTKTCASRHWCGEAHKDQSTCNSYV